MFTGTAFAADSAEDERDTLRGFFASGNLGVIAHTGNFSWTTSSPSAAMTSGSKRVLASGGHASFAGGFAPISGLAIAVEAGASVNPIVNSGADLATFGELGLLVAWRPFRPSPLRFRLGLGVAGAKFEGPERECEAFCSPIASEAHGLFGPMARLGVAYSWRAQGFEYGPTFDLRGIRLNGEIGSGDYSVHMSLFSATLGFGVAWW